MCSSWAVQSRMSSCPSSEPCGSWSSTAKQLSFFGLALEVFWCLEVFFDVWKFFDVFCCFPCWVPPGGTLAFEASRACEKGSEVQGGHWASVLQPLVLSAQSRSVPCLCGHGCDVQKWLKRTPSINTFGGHVHKSLKYHSLQLITREVKYFGKSAMIELLSKATRVSCSLCLVFMSAMHIVGARCFPELQWM